VAAIGSDAFKKVSYFEVQRVLYCTVWEGPSDIRLMQPSLSLSFYFILFFVTQLRAGPEHYLDRHKYSNTITNDLWAALEESSGKAREGHDGQLDHPDGVPPHHGLHPARHWTVLCCAVLDCAVL